jgi:hypothetical protein
LSVFVLAICAISSGSEGREAIEDFGKEKEDCLHPAKSISFRGSKNVL